MNEPNSTPTHVRPDRSRRPRPPIAEYAADKKAIDIAELDLRGVLGYTDFFVVCSGNTDRQTKAIHDGSTRASRTSTACCRAASRASARRAGSSWTTST